MNRFYELAEEYPHLGQQRYIGDQLKEYGIEDINDYIIFKGTKGNKQFKKSYDILKDKNTIEYTPETHELVAQTIDGDYIFKCGEDVLVVPVSLDKNMTERFENFSILRFFGDYTEGKIYSSILANK